MMVAVQSLPTRAESLRHSSFISCRLVYPSGRTGVVNDGELQLPGKLDDMLFGHVDHGPDDRHVHPAQIGHGREQMQTPLKKKAHEEGLHHILPVMTQGHLVAAMFLGQIVEGPRRSLAHMAQGFVSLRMSNTTSLMSVFR